jgi:hypothetical protein
VLFDRGDADCELEAFVEIGSHVILDDGESARVVIENLRVIGERGFDLGNRGEAALDGREDAVESRLGLLGRLLLCGHTRGVYHGGRRGHECADRLDVTQHENWKKTARILEAGKRLKIMQTGCDVHHGFQQVRGQRAEGLSRGEASLFRGARGRAEYVGERVKPRSREAVRRFPQGFTRDDRPGETEC